MVPVSIYYTKVLNYSITIIHLPTYMYSLTTNIVN
jgi:hypothetical protein